ncbi:hypothetical protein L195_g031468 [Trifolium pratense]|uniref:Uncharacterized protein n=1 Tax=Trifolium pratense TaxID=57577 RepID=A0A2K3LAG9_TRIPR|nr:hypothetical protein L195_g031468 [Trifolium pratense]
MMAARVPPDLSNKMTKLTINPDHSRCTMGEKVGQTLQGCIKIKVWGYKLIRSIILIKSRSTDSILSTS